MFSVRYCKLLQNPDMGRKQEPHESVKLIRILSKMVPAFIQSFLTLETLLFIFQKKPTFILSKARTVAMSQWKNLLLL